MNVLTVMTNFAVVLVLLGLLACSVPTPTPTVAVTAAPPTVLPTATPDSLALLRTLTAQTAAPASQATSAATATSPLIPTPTPGPTTWAKTYGGSSYDYASSIAPTNDGGYIVAGYTYSFGGRRGDAWVLKLDGSGNVVWQKTYGGSGYDVANAIAQTSDGGYIVAGYTRSFGAGGDEAWVFKLDASGNVGGTCSMIANSSAGAVGSAGTMTNTPARITRTTITVSNSDAAVSNTTAQVAVQCGT